MKVHLITARPSIEHDITTLRKMVDIIQGAGHELVRYWLEDAYKQVINNPDAPKLEWSKIYKANLEAITKADVVIAEVSYESFGVGYQVALAVQLKKPVLLLLHENADKNALFASGVEDTWVLREEYDDKNLPIILGKFLKDNDIQTKDMRFNFFIDRPIYNYLRWAALKTGKTKAEILRDLVSKEIDKANNVDQL